MKNTKNILSKVLLSFMSIFFIFGCFTQPVNAAKNAQHVWQPVYDFDSSTIISQVLTYSDGNYVRWSPINTVEETFDVTGDWATLQTNAANGIYANAWPGVAGFSGSANERSYAMAVVDELTQSFNTALLQIIRDNGYDMSNQETLVELSANVAQCALTGNSCSYGEGAENWFSFRTPSTDEWSAEKISESIGSKFQSAGRENFRYLETADLQKAGNKVLLPVSLPKGYESGQKLYGINRDKMDASKQPTNVSWQHMILMAKWNYKTYSISSSNMDELQEMSEIENILAQIIQKIFDGIQSILGLTSMEDLMLNRGTRDVLYYKGVVNNSWFSVANGIHWVSQIISVFAIIIGIVLALIKRNVALVNPNARVSLKENLLDFAYVLVLLVAFNLIFYGLLQLNYLLVGVLSAMAPTDATLTGTFGTSGPIAAIIIAFCVLFFELKMNITYLLRGITIIALYATAPLFIISLIYGKKGKELFGTWVKELVGNVFMQTFHALIMVIFLTVVSKSPTTSIEKIIIIYSFLPLTQFFKDKFLGQTATDSASAQAAKGAGSVVSSGIGLAMMVGAAGIGAMSGAGEGLRDIVQGKQEDVSSRIADVPGSDAGVSAASNTVSAVSSRGNSTYNANRAMTAEAKEDIIKSKVSTAFSGNGDSSTFSFGRMAKKAGGVVGGSAMWVASEAAQMGAQSIGADTGNIRHAQALSAGVASGSWIGFNEERRDLGDENAIRAGAANQYDYDEEFAYNQGIEEDGGAGLIVVDDKDNEWNEGDDVNADNDYFVMTELSEDLMDKESQDLIRAAAEDYNEKHKNDIGYPPIHIHETDVANVGKKITAVGYAPIEKTKSKDGKYNLNFKQTDEGYNYSTQYRKAYLAPNDMKEYGRNISSNKNKQ